MSVPALRDQRWGAGEVAALAHISARQLDHWRRMGLIWPAQPAAGKGRPARFDDEDLAWVLAVAEAVRAGVMPGSILLALERGHVSDLADRLRNAADALEACRPEPLALLRTSL